mmetsp:Transcript_26669/g.43859  ORF Transcript_26669/g.43859 Transcript_26669/m.43859 type:complete len:164 (-) Transcript_26669:30-521(-)
MFFSLERYTSTKVERAQERVHCQSRQDYVDGVWKFLETEQMADSFMQNGKARKARKKYKKSLLIQEQILGKNHPVVSDFQEKIRDSQMGGMGPGTMTTRWSTMALLESLQMERRGDRLAEMGNYERARKMYERSYTIESIIVGENHPMVLMMHEKMSLIATLQ